MVAESELGNFNEICSHLKQRLPEIDDDVVIQFTGNSNEYNLLCEVCGSTSHGTISLITVADSEKHKAFYSISRIVGNPPISERQTNFRFTHRIVNVDPALPPDLIDIRPFEAGDKSTWVILTRSGYIFHFDSNTGACDLRFQIAKDMLELTDNSRLHISPTGNFAAVVNDFGSQGLVLDLIHLEITMFLDRGDYYPDQTTFPAAFFVMLDQEYLVHATESNRLDISSPGTSQLVTERQFDPWLPDSPRPKHIRYCNFAGIYIGPSAEWVAGDSWIWHPSGVVIVWSLKEWINSNVWESEDGKSLKLLTYTDDYWGRPMCWIDETTLAVWGIGSWVGAMTPAVRLFDVKTGKRISWFNGPKKGPLIFDEYLFSTSYTGTEVWDVATGERLHYDKELVPNVYHYGSHEFLTIMPEGTVRLSRLSST